MLEVQIHNCNILNEKVELSTGTPPRGRPWCLQPTMVSPGSYPEIYISPSWIQWLILQTAKVQHVKHMSLMPFPQSIHCHVCKWSIFISHRLNIQTQREPLIASLFDWSSNEMWHRIYYVPHHILMVKGWRRAKTTTGSQTPPSRGRRTLSFSRLFCNFELWRIKLSTCTIYIHMCPWIWKQLQLLYWND